MTQCLDSWILLSVAAAVWVSQVTKTSFDQYSSNSLRHIVGLPGKAGQVRASERIFPMSQQPLDSSLVAEIMMMASLVFLVLSRSSGDER